jgi:hypothetical protein
VENRILPRGVFVREKEQKEIVLYIEDRDTEVSKSECVMEDSLRRFIKFLAGYMNETKRRDFKPPRS